jgi:hypothetical protein
MTLAVSALMTAAVQAAPTRAPHKGSAPEVGLFQEMWSWLTAGLRGTRHTSSFTVTPTSTSQLDPNGGNH